MNILFVANCSLLYGANRSMLDLAIALEKRGFTPFFVFPKQGPLEDKHILHNELDKHNFTYVHIDYCLNVHVIGDIAWLEQMVHEKVNRKCILELEQYVKRWEIDIIHTNSSTNLIGAEVAKRTNKPHVWHIREALKADYGFIVDNVMKHRKLLKKANKIICISEYVRKMHRRLLVGTNVEVIYNGFKVDNYNLEDAYHKDSSVFNILLCGVIRESKGQLDAVKAIHSLIRDYGCTNVQLKIVGGGSGKYFNSICNYIETNNLSAYIKLIPYQNDLKLYRREADIVLMCSRNEALGRVTVESMLSENIVIGTNSAGTAELIESGVNGYLYEVGNIDDLCHKILFVIRNWEQQKQVVETAKQYAYENFDSEKYADKIRDIYLNIESKDSKS